MTQANSGGFRKRCYLDVAAGERPLGRIVVELFDDVVPKTAENFRGLATAEYGTAQAMGKKLSYQNVLFHRVIPGFMVQAGDLTCFDGTGGESIYGGKFEDENFRLKHDKPYLLSMANAGPNSNGSQFFITCVPCPSLDNKHVVFGQVISGQEVVRAVEGSSVDSGDRPIVPVKIVKCGQLVPVIPAAGLRSQSARKPTASSHSDTDLEGEAGAKKKRKKEKKKTKRQKRRLEKSQEEAKAEPAAFCTIRPEEVPEIPENRFLGRRTAEVAQEPGAGSSAQAHSSGKPNVDQHSTGSFPDRTRFDRQGLKIKGRGQVRYDRRSVTPPHWKKPQPAFPPNLGQNSQSENWSKSEQAPENGQGVQRRNGQRNDGRHRSPSPRRRKDKSEHGARRCNSASGRPSSDKRRRRSGSRSPNRFG